MTEKLYSIGDVAQATGISVYTLRMWERRYGAPFSEKLDSGHRRYQPSEVSRLRMVKMAVDNGWKASEVVACSEAELRARLIDEAKQPSSDFGNQIMMERLLGFIKDWDEDALIMMFRQEWEALGPVGFVTDFAPFFLERVGTSWFYGELSIAAEHFATAILVNFLADRWRQAPVAEGATKVLLTTLEGERHVLGLEMCAVVVAAVGGKVFYLGASTPVEEIAYAALTCSCQMVCVSVSRTYDAQQATKLLKQLRAELPDEVQIVVGGAGAPHSLIDIVRFQHFKAFYDWLRVQQEREA